MALTIREFDASTWPDFEKLFSKNGMASSCWCIYYQRPESAERERKRYGVPIGGFAVHNKRRKKELVTTGRSHGILVYSEGEPVGWCAYGPRDEFPRIDRGRHYRKLQPREEDGLWRIACFVVDKGHRKQGVAAASLRAALASIRRQGGGTVEAYPVVSTKGGSQSMWFGTVGMFEREGFTRVGPLGNSVLMRKAVR